MAEIQGKIAGIERVVLHPGNSKDSCAEPVKETHVLLNILSGMKKQSKPQVKIELSNEVIDVDKK